MVKMPASCLRPTLKASGYGFKPAEAGCRTATFRWLALLARGFEPLAAAKPNQA